MRQTNEMRSGRSATGFSLIEMMIVVVLISIMAAMAMYSIVGALPNIRVNNGLNVAMNVVKNGKYLAVSQRRNYQLMFAPPARLWLRRLNVPAGFTDLPPVDLPGGVQFILFPNIIDTPDGYGNAAAIDFRGTPTQTFMSNEQFVNAAGQFLDGTIYVGIPGNSATQRAITISGATGRIRAYRWNGASWLEY